MSRAEQQALIAYPRDIEKKMSGTIDHNLTRRNAYIKGYEQAVRDLALTWEDMREVYVTFDSLDRESRSTFNMGIEEYFQEALRRFNEKKHE